MDFSRAATTNWNAAPLGQSLVHYDRLRTRQLSEAAVQLVDLSIIRLAELSQLEMVPPREAAAKARFHFESGKMYFIDRLKPREVEIQTRSAVAAILGTEFHLIVDANGRTELNLIDGKVQLSNPLGTVSLDSGDRGIAEPGQAPIKETAVLKATNLVQWYMYYPGVLDPDELGLSPIETQALSASLTAYRAGDILAALTNYPSGRGNVSAAEAAYRDGLLLASGRITNSAVVVPALRWVIAAVLQEAAPPALPATNASQLLGKSYYMQSIYDLDSALVSARQAIERSPKFGFAWARVAELEFSFGRNRHAETALDRALELSPRNAQAHALRGFILLGRNRIKDALTAFDTALEIDSRLANAWLGRGLARFQQGARAEGRADIQTATAMEPNRWLLRSYLGKAFGVKEADLAFKEFDLNHQMDPRDPTPLLYSALLNQQEHRVGQAITELEESVALNDNRRVYRSRLLLDQDLAVRSAGLAPIYQRAGMDDVSLREAARAVSYDYANYSAHLFLANSYDAFRDPTRFHLRYETVWFNELLLANILAPVGAGALSQNISQQEYFRLFEARRFGLVSDTRYRGDDQYRALVSQFGTVHNTSYALDLDYQHNAGVRPNNELDRIEWYTTIKQQLTPQDSLLLLTKYQDYHSGDNFQYYDPTNARPNFSFDEYQKPVALLGYHHEWTPGVHTLVLGGRLESDVRISDRNAPQTLLLRDTQNPSNAAPIILVDRSLLDVDYRSQIEIFAAEAQQVWDNRYHTFIAGGRWQGGQFDTENLMTNPSIFGPDFPNPPAEASIEEDFQRISAYAYETLKLPGNLRLTGGVAYDHLTYPQNYRMPPIAPGESARERFNPKASLVWELSSHAAVRAAYARSLGGVTFDESYRLEPTQLAGFSQAFRTLIPESLVGSVAAPDHEILGTALDFKLKTRTYLGFQAGILRSEVRRQLGLFDYFYAEPPPNIVPSSTRQELDYEEKSAGITVNQLLSDEWALSAQYLFTRSELIQTFPDVPPLNPTINGTNRAELHRINLALLFNHPCGFFARAEGQWWFQQNLGSADVGGTIEKDLPDESLPQVNLFIGYRLRRQRGDITIGVLNLTDEDYRLNPVSPYYELPRERVFYAQLRLRF